MALFIYLICNGTEWEVIDGREVLHCMLALYAWMDACMHGSISRRGPLRLLVPIHLYFFFDR